MAGKPLFHYDEARGRMESVRWLLAAAGVEYEEKFLQTNEDLEKLRSDGVLMFQQVPMVEVDGMRLVQTRAILNYFSSKYNLYGKDMKERALIDMYSEGLADLNELFIVYPYDPPGVKEAKIAQMKEKAKNRYFPAFEKVLKSHGQDFLVGNKLSKADIHLVEMIYNMEELDANIIANFPLLQALKTRISDMPNIKKFLQPGSRRQPPVDEKTVLKARKIFKF
ncbi:glutathione S-transferase A6 [Mesocricetus auratus]|uniref:glutathione transferase n=1 Tax=Mesocricetus auratus TaxID=10036 RepID=A0A1U7R5S8_MESAU|nr:glutathione S-transferase A6 [Mesocricetus auratus]